MTMSNSAHDRLRANATLFLALLLPAALVTGVYLSVTGLLADADRTLSSRIETLARLRNNIDAGQRALNSPVTDPLVEFAGDFLSGSQESIVVAELQNRLRGLAIGNKVELNSAHALPSRSIGAVSYLGLRMVLRGRVPDIQRVLHTIETGVPLLFVERIGMRIDTWPMKSTEPAVDGAPALVVEMDIFGARNTANPIAAPAVVIGLPRRQRSRWDGSTDVWRVEWRLVTAIDCCGAAAMTRFTTLFAVLVVLILLSVQAGHAVWSAVSETSAAEIAASAQVQRRDAAPGTKATGFETPQPSISSFPLTATDPVFFEGRKYPKRDVAPSAPAVVAPPPVPILKVEGVVLRGVFVHGPQHRALLEVAARPPSWVAVGDVVQAWTITEISNNSVRLIREGQVAILQLYDFSAID